MPRSHFLRWAALSPAVLITLFLVAGCGHSVQNAAAPPAPVATAANSLAAPAAPAPTAAFQPYTLLPPPPAPPPVVTPRHRVFHVTRLHNQVYLADSDRHLYEAGRDSQGHIYPIYRDPNTHVTYPLYYDARRDDMYRLAREDGGHFYRNYVGEGRTRFYESDRDYEQITPTNADRPIVTDSYNTYNYNDYNDGPSYGNGYSDDDGYRPYPYDAGYRSAPHHSSHSNDNWLWAIPVIIGAYLLLQPHHHSSPPPARTGPTTVIVRQSTPITIINQITQAAPVGYRPIASPRPVYVYPPGYNARPGYAPLRPSTVADVRPHRPFAPVSAALAVPAARASFIRPASHAPVPAPPVRPVPLAARPAAPAVPRTALRPTFRPVPAVRRAHVSEQRVQPSIARRPAPLLVSRPIVHHPTPVSPRIVRLSPAERPRVVTPPAPRPVQHRIEAARPRPVARPQVIVHPRVVSRPPVIVRPRTVPRPQMIVRPRAAARPRPVAEPRRVPVRPAPAPRRPAPPRPIVIQPRPARPAPSVRASVVRAPAARAPELTRRPEAPRRASPPSAAPKPEAARRPKETDTPDHH